MYAEEPDLDLHCFLLLDPDPNSVGGSGSSRSTVIFRVEFSLSVAKKLNEFIFGVLLGLFLNYRYQYLGTGTVP